MNLKIERIDNGEETTLKFIGRLDASTIDFVQDYILLKMDDIQKLVLDCAQLDYTTSGGLRTMMNMKIKMNKRGGMRLINLNDSIKKIFEMTGFDMLLGTN